MEPKLIYQPSTNSGWRVSWYGGESTQLHFQKLWNVWDADTDETTQEWQDRDVRTLGCMPTRMKEMFVEMAKYYEYATTMEIERRMQLI